MKKARHEKFARPIQIGHGEIVNYWQIIEFGFE